MLLRWEGGGCCCDEGDAVAMKRDAVAMGGRGMLLRRGDAIAMKKGMLLRWRVANLTSRNQRSTAGYIF